MSLPSHHQHQHHPVCHCLTSAKYIIWNANSRHLFRSLIHSFFISFPLSKNPFEQQETISCVWQQRVLGYHTTSAEEPEYHKMTGQCSGQKPEDWLQCLAHQLKHSMRETNSNLLCFVLINSIFFKLLCVWINVTYVLGQVWRHPHRWLSAGLPWDFCSPAAELR